LGTAPPGARSGVAMNEDIVRQSVKYNTQKKSCVPRKGTNGKVSLC